MVVVVVVVVELGEDIQGWRGGGVVWDAIEWGGTERRGAEQVGLGWGGGAVGGVARQASAMAAWDRMEAGDRTRLIGVGWEQRRRAGDSCGESARDSWGER